MLLRQDRAMSAVAIVLDVAFHSGGSGTVSAGDIADRIGQARRGIEPLLQTLSRAGLLESVRGPRGGYRLGRPRRDLRLLDIVASVLDGDVSADAPAGKLQAAVVVPLWADLEQEIRDRLDHLTIEDLMARADKAGLKRTPSQPLNFTI